MAVPLPTDRQQRRRGALACIALFGLCYVGYMKGIPSLAGVPVDLTLLCGAVTGLAIFAVVFSGRSFDWRVVACVLGLWAVFGIGAVMDIGAERGASKIALLYTLTLLCALGPCFLLVSAQAQRLWLYLSVASGLAMAVAAVLIRDGVAWAEFRRLNVDGTSTIGTARVIGAAAVVAAIMMAVTSGRRRLWWSAAAVSCTGLVVMVGSRGPVVGLVVAVLVALFLGKVMHRRRASALAMALVVVTASAWAVVESSVRHPDRISRFLSGDINDAAREALVGEALIAIVRNPLGVGWDGFGAIPAVQSAYGGRSVYPHNFLIEIFVEGGWLAGAFVLVLMGLSIRGYVMNSRTSESAAMLGLGVYWLVVAQTSGDINGNRTTWVMLVLGLVFYFKERDVQRLVGAASDVGWAGYRELSRP